jgi:hypothetical protein
MCINYNKKMETTSHTSGRQPSSLLKKLHDTAPTVVNPFAGNEAAWNSRPSKKRGGKKRSCKKRGGKKRSCKKRN